MVSGNIVVPLSVSRIKTEEYIFLFKEPRGPAIIIKETAAEIWRLIEIGRKSKNIIAELSDKYNTTPNSIIKEDVLTFIKELADLGFLEIKPSRRRLEKERR